MAKRGIWLSGVMFIALALTLDKAVAQPPPGGVQGWGRDAFNMVTAIPSDEDFIAVGAGWFHCVGLQKGTTSFRVFVLPNATARTA